MSGLLVRAAENVRMKLLPNRVYFMGASFRPTRILITRVDEAVDAFWYKRLPLGEGTREIQDSIKYGGLMIVSGCKSELRRIQAYISTVQEGAVVDGYLELKSHLESLLSGGEGSETSEEEETVYSVRVKVVDGGFRQDGWALIDQLTGGCCNAYYSETEEYECSAFGVSHLDELNSHDRITVVSSEPRKAWEDE